MPVGCEFICKNESCEYNNTGFNMLGQWPISRIEIIISSNVISKKPNIKKELIDLKRQGVKYSCIIYPNYNEIEAVGVRINMWNPKELKIENYDILYEENKPTEILIDEKIPDVCPKTGNKLLSFSEVTKDGINCPKCNQKMFQNRWFTNEE